ncbi:unnamed protein product [Adineta steineri]|uniref:Purinergic receptor n=1 Tax=Adineta steineri TaxID=433720 RepID=A0A814GN20_9BILA|nr:unnamed protein product [Adineta steineri]
MNHALTKKFDKILSKLSNKHKDSKVHNSDPTDCRYYQDNIQVDGDNGFQQESILHRMKSHLGHTMKTEQQRPHPEGVPPFHVIYEDLKNSPFKVYGLRFVVSITGKGGQFNIVNLFLAIGSGIGFMVIAGIVCDAILMYVHRSRETYRRGKFSICEVDNDGMRAQILEHSHA